MSCNKINQRKINHIDIQEYNGWQGRSGFSASGSFQAVSRLDSIHTYSVVKDRKCSLI